MRSNNKSAKTPATVSGISGISCGSVITSNNWYNNTTSSVTMAIGGGGGGYASSLHGITYPFASTPAVTISGATIDGGESEITLTKDGRTLRVGKSINLLLEHLMLIVPDDRELESNPALKLAYENYLEARKRHVDPELTAAYESYQLIRNITRDE